MKTNSRVLISSPCLYKTLPKEVCTDSEALIQVNNQVQTNRSEMKPNRFHTNRLPNRKRKFKHPVRSEPSYWTILLLDVRDPPDRSEPYRMCLNVQQAALQTSSQWRENNQRIQQKLKLLPEDEKKTETCWFVIFNFNLIKKYNKWISLSYGWTLIQLQLLITDLFCYRRVR